MRRESPEKPAAAQQSAAQTVSPLLETKPLAGEKRYFAAALASDLATRPEKDIASGGHVVDTLTASLWCLLTSRDYTETVLKAVNLGGDTDTTGVATGGLAGVYYGLASVPTRWHTAMARARDLECLFKKFTLLVAPNEAMDAGTNNSR